MKCKQGDLAFIKKSVRNSNLGKIVTCKKYLGYYELNTVINISGENWRAPISDDYWLISGNIETLFGTAPEAYIPDSWLSPISPLDESEEDDYSLEDDLALVE